MTMRWGEFANPGFRLSHPSPSTEAFTWEYVGSLGICGTSGRECTALGETHSHTEAAATAQRQSQNAGLCRSILCHGRQCPALGSLPGKGAANSP